MADVDVEPEKIIAEETKEPKSVNIDAMGADDLVNKEIELTRNKSKFGRYAYNEAKELAAIQRRLYGSPKVNMPKTLSNEDVETLEKLNLQSNFTVQI